jgi:hypothetical protein
MLLLAAALAVAVAEAQEPVEPTDPRLARIRQALATPAIQLSPANPEPTFRVGIVGQQLLLAGPSDWSRPPAEPPIPGGLYAFEQRQRLGNPWAGQPLIKVDVLPVVGVLLDALRAAGRERALRQARREVATALEEFCASADCAADDVNGR